MKWNGTGRIAKALVASLAVGLGMTACSRDYTLGYLYVTASQTAQISSYSIDFQSGSLQQLDNSPGPASDRTDANPVAIVAAPNGKTVYVVNHDNSTVVRLAVGTDGKLYGLTTTNVVMNTAGTIIGSFPTAAAIDTAGNYLYVTFTYQNGFTNAFPGPGGVAVFPIMHSSDSSVEGTLGAPVMNSAGLPYFPVGNAPVGIATATLPGATTTTGTSYVYVVDQEHTAAGAAFGSLLGFTENSTTGALTAFTGVGTGVGVYSSGTTPSAVAADPTGRFVYVTDQATNVVNAYKVAGSSLQALSTSPFVTGQLPMGITIDPRGAFLYVANYGSSTVSAFTIDTSSGSLSGGGGTGVATGPTCVTIEPALGIYLYTSNRLDNSVSAAQLDPHTGALRQVQGTQFTAAARPSCAATIANGAHASEIIR